MRLLDRLARLDRLAEERTGWRRTDVPGHIASLLIAFIVMVLGVGAQMSSEREPARFFLGMGLGIMAGASIMVLAGRRAEAKRAKQ